MNGLVFSREFEAAIADIQDPDAYARLGQDLKDWLGEWHSAGLMTLPGIEAILRLLVLRQVSLMPEPVLLPLLAFDEADLLLQAEAERVWRIFVATGLGLEAVIREQAMGLTPQHGVLHLLLTPSDFFDWSSVPELALRRLLERLQQVNHSLLWMSLIESQILKCLLREPLDRSVPLTRRLSSSLSLSDSFVPQGITNLLAALVPIISNQSVYDPFCGLGQVFREIVYQSCGNKHFYLPTEVQWFAQDVPGNSVFLARLSFLLLHIQPLQWFDSTHFSKSWWQGFSKKPGKFDCVVSLIPPHLRFEGESDADAFLISNIFSLLETNARAVLAVPARFLFRRSAYSVRKYLLEKGAIDYVICLPDGVFKLSNHNTLPMVVLMLKRRLSFLPEPPKLKPNEMAYRLIDASLLPLDSERAFPTQSLFRAVYREEVLDTRLSFCDVTMGQCRAEDYNLNPSLYLSTSQRSFELERGLAQFDAAEQERSKALQDMTDCLVRLRGIRSKEA